MRITLNMQTDQSVVNLNDDQEQITRLSQEISSGQKLASPSDDPYSWAQSMNVTQAVREYNSFLDGINFATGWGQATESALNQLSDLVSQAKQIAISASSATGANQSSALASQLDSVAQQALNLANSQYGDQYIFAGSSTDSAPFSIDSGTVNYQGDSNSIQVKTGAGSAPGSSTAVNLTGDDLFSYTSGGQSLNVLQEILDLKQAVQSGDSATVSSKLTTLDDAFNHINNELTVMGSRLSTLSDRQSAINTMVTNQQGALSKLKDTDIASATTKLAQAQSAFQAALQVTSLLNNLNLASYLSGSSTG